MKLLFSFAIFIAAIICCPLISLAQDIISTNGQKFVVLEESTAQWCPPCIDGYVDAGELLKNYPKTILLNHHKYDGLMNMRSDSFLIEFGCTAYPMATIDRAPYVAYPHLFMLGSHWQNAVQTRQALPPVFDLKLAYVFDAVTGTISATVTGTALTNLSGNYRMNLMIVQDSIFAEQHNSGNGKTGHQYYGKGNPITSFCHMNTVRDMLGGVHGVPSFTNPATNTSVSKTFTYAVPSYYNINHIKLVAVVSRYDATNIKNNEILNALATGTTLACTGNPPIRQMCMVTVNQAASVTLMWDTAGINLGMKYTIYRDSAGQNNFKMIAKNVLSTKAYYHDNTAQPLKNEYAYKMVVTDNCNWGSALYNAAMTHSTIFLQRTNTGGKAVLNWSHYTGVPFSSYYVMRSNNGGTFTQIAKLSTTVNTYTDNAPPAGANEYRIEVKNSSLCTTLLPRIYSNTTPMWATGVAYINNNTPIAIYPNPAAGQLNISDAGKGSTISIYDITGRLVIRSVTYSNDATVTTTGMSPGVYMLQVTNTDGSRSSVRFQKQ